VSSNERYPGEREDLIAGLSELRDQVARVGGGDRWLHRRLVEVLAKGDLEDMRSWVSGAFSDTPASDPDEIAEPSRTFGDHFEARERNGTALSWGRDSLEVRLRRTLGVGGLAPNPLGCRAQADRLPRRQQCPPCGMDLGAVSFGHLRSHVDPVEQLTEQEAEQVMCHVELPVQEMLPLAPTVTLHVDPDAQFRLHESPQLPEQTLWSVQSSEQLDGPHRLGLNEQD